MRVLILLLLLLAACSDSQASEDAAPTKSHAAPPAAEKTTGRAAQSTADLRDFDDPRLFLDLDHLRWEQWETPVDGDRLARLRALGITPLRTDSTGPREVPDPADSVYYDPHGEHANDYHFIDFSGDGVDDVIYSGAWYERNDLGSVGAAEGSQIKLFQVIDGRAVQVMKHHGSLQRIWKGGGGPISFRTFHPGCCAEVSWEIHYFRPVMRGDTVRFEPYHHVIGRVEMEMPTRFFASPRRFTVNNDNYLLRAEPAIQDTTPSNWNDWEGRGNAVAEYARGARGTALAEKTDATGRVWWFVRMDGATPPTAAQADAPYVGDHPVPADRLGWMSSRFVTVQP